MEPVKIIGQYVAHLDVLPDELQNAVPSGPQEMVSTSVAVGSTQEVARRAAPQTVSETGAGV